MNNRFVKNFTPLVATVLVAFGAVSPAVATSSVSIIGPLETGKTYTGYPAISNDGSLAAVTNEEEGLNVFEVATRTRHDLSPDEIGSYDIGHSVFSPDNKWLYVADYQNSGIIVVDLTDFSFDHRIAPPSFGRSWSLAISPNGDLLYVRDMRAIISKISLATEQVVGVIQDDGTGNEGMCLSSDGAKLYSPSARDTVAVIDTVAMSLATTWNVGSQVRAKSCTIDNEGNILVALQGTGAVARYTPDGTPTITQDRTFSWVTGVAASCDTIYVGDSGHSNSVPKLDYNTFTALDPITLTPNAGDEFFAGGAVRSLDGSVVALGGTNAHNGLTLILSPECKVVAPDPDTDTDSGLLAETGADGFSLGIWMLAGLALIAIGSVAMVRGRGFKIQ